MPWRTTPAGEVVHGRFAFVRVVAAHPVTRDHQPPRWEWLIIEWPADQDAPTDYWLSNLPEDATTERLARLARLRWTIELDYRQLKGELGLDHYEGRSYRGFHHHCALVTCAHAFLTLERMCPKRGGRPYTPAGGAAAAAPPALLGRPLPHLSPARRPPPARPLPPT